MRLGPIRCTLIAVPILAMFVGCNLPGNRNQTENKNAAQPQATPETIIEITSDPAGAAVTLISADALGAGAPKRLGTTPLSRSGVSPGKYVVHLEKPGYKFFQQEVELKVTEPLKIGAKLKKQ